MYWSGHFSLSLDSLLPQLEPPLSLVFLHTHHITASAKTVHMLTRFKFVINLNILKCKQLYNHFLLRYRFWLLIEIFSFSISVDLSSSKSFQMYNSVRRLSSHDMTDGSRTSMWNSGLKVSWELSAEMIWTGLIRLNCYGHQISQISACMTRTWIG